MTWRASGQAKLFPDPSRLEGLLIANQVASYSRSISKFTGQSFTRLYLLKSLQDDAAAR